MPESQGRRRRRLCYQKLSEELDMDLIYFHPPARTEFSDEGYAAIGRALTVATHFEASCRCLAEVLEFKDAVREPNRRFSLDEESAFLDLVGKVNDSNLNANLRAVSKDMRLPEQFDTLLHDGRKARNFIAHELSLGVANDVETTQGRDVLLAMVRDAVRTIAQADSLVCSLIAFLTHEPLMTATALDTYADRVLEWVCEVFV